MAAGTVDCFLSIQFLCSVDDAKTVVRQIRHLLKPCGELVFWEHQEHEIDWLTRLAQGIWNIFWTPVIGNCRLNKSTRKAILAVADWEIIELGADTEGPLDLMPRVWGRLKTKPED